MLASKINRKISYINDLLDIIKRYGEDISEYEDRLSVIEESIHMLDKSLLEIYSNNSSSVQVMRQENAYAEPYRLLVELEKELEEYQKFLIIHFKNMSLKDELDKNLNSISKNISTYRSEALKLISSVENLNFESLEEAEKEIYSVYETAYEIIKLELIIYSHSLLLTKVKKDSNAVVYINDLVREDIEDNNLFDNSDITNRINELSKDGIDYTYLDEKLILTILLNSDERVIDNINTKIELLKEVDEVALSLEEKIKERKSDNNVKTISRRHGLSNSRIKALIASGLAALNFFAFKGANKILENANTDITYMTERTTYNSSTGETSVSNELEYKSGDNKVIIKEYKEVNKSGNRKLTYYKTGDMIEDISEYVNYDKKSTTSSITVPYLSAEQSSKEEYTIVESIKYGDKHIDFDEETYNSQLQISKYFFYGLGSVEALFFLRYLLVVLKKKKEINSLIREIKEDEKQLNDISEEKKSRKEKVKKLEVLKGKDTIGYDEYKKSIK